jgi:hypothetical protein
MATKKKTSRKSKTTSRRKAKAPKKQAKRQVKKQAPKKQAKKQAKRKAARKPAKRKTAAQSKSATKRNSLSKKAATRKSASSATKKTPKSSQPREQRISYRQPEPHSGDLSGDLQGLSDVEGADSESVDELLEEGNAFEAGVVEGVEASEGHGEKEVHTREVPEDDVPGEYLDEE